MKIGILNGLSKEIQEELSTNEFKHFTDLFATVQHDHVFVEYPVADGCFPDLAACDAYLITGSPSGAYEKHSWIVKLSEFISAAYERGIPLVGICFGHQILAHALGGLVEKSPKGYGVGRDTLHMKLKPEWMVPKMDSLDLHYFHQDQVVRLPPKAKLIGGSDFCPNGLFVIGDQVFGIQAHPEMLHSRLIRGMRWLKDKGSSQMLQLADRAEASLIPGRADGSIVAQWILNFLNK